MKVIRLVILTCLLLLGGVFFLNAVGFINYSFWAPKYAKAERQVFENTPSYVQGKVNYLTTLRLDYERAEPGNQKNALKTAIITEAATVDHKQLPASLQASYAVTVREGSAVIGSGTRL